MSILLGSYHHECLAGNGWKCNILIWNRRFLKEEGLYYTFLPKSHFRHFLLFFPISANISLSVIDNMVPFYMDAHILIMKTNIFILQSRLTNSKVRGPSLKFELVTFQFSKSCKFEKLV